MRRQTSETPIDSCSILYKTTIQRVRNGRSAALSITNLFSRSSEKVRQPEPSITVQSIQSEGIISHSGAIILSITHLFLNTK